MSLRVLTQVWEHAKAEGGDLLVLLALADEARDNGACYPGLARIALKARMSERNVRYVLRRLEASGELVVVAGGGRANTNAYEIRVSPNLDLQLIHNQANLTTEERGQDFPKPGKIAPKRGQSATETRKPAAPEPYYLKATVPSGQGKPSPVASLWTTYLEGMQALYKASPAPSAAANGKLALLVKKLGAEAAPRVLAFYLRHPEPFYKLRRHPLELLVRDADKLWIELQQTTGEGAHRAAPTKAVVHLEYPDGRSRMLDDFPVGDHLQVARDVAKTYAMMIGKTNPSRIAVQVGAERRAFALDEVRA